MCDAEFVDELQILLYDSLSFIFIGDAVSSLSVQITAE